MAQVNASVLHLADLAGVTQASRAPQVVIGSDPHGGFHGLPKATAKTRSDLLNRRKWQRSDEGIKLGGMKWHQGGGRPGPPKANTPRVLASKTMSERDSMAKTLGAKSDEIPSMTKTRSQVVERRKKQQLESGQKFKPTAEPSAHGIQLPVKYKEMTKQGKAWWQNQDHLKGYPSGTAFWGPDGESNFAKTVDGAFGDPYTSKQRRREARGTGGDPLLPVGPVSPRQRVQQGTGAAIPDSEVTHRDDDQLGRTLSGPQGHADTVVRRTKPRRRVQVQNGAWKEVEIPPDSLRKRAATAGDLQRSKEARRHVAPKPSEITHTLSKLYQHTLDRWTVRVLDYENMVNPKELQDQYLDEFGKSTLWDPQEDRPMYTQFLKNQAYHLTRKWEPPRPKFGEKRKPPKLQPTNLSRKLAGMSFGSSIALPEGEDQDGDELVIEPGSAAAVMNYGRETREEPDQQRGHKRSGRASGLDHTTGYHPDSRPDRSGQPVLPFGVHEPPITPPRQKHDLPTLPLDLAEPHRGRGYILSGKSGKSGKPHSYAPTQAAASSMVVQEDGWSYASASSGAITGKPNRSTKQSRPASSPAGKNRASKTTAPLRERRSVDVRLDITDAQYPDVSLMVHSRDEPSGGSSEPHPKPRPGARIPGKDSAKYRSEPLSPPARRPMNQRAALRRQASMQASLAERPSTVSGGLRALSRSRSRGLTKSASQVIRTGGL